MEAFVTMVRETLQATSLRLSVVELLFFYAIARKTRSYYDRHRRPRRCAPRSTCRSLRRSARGGQMVQTGGPGCAAPPRRPRNRSRQAREEEILRARDAALSFGCAARGPREQLRDRRRARALHVDVWL